VIDQTPETVKHNARYIRLRDEQSIWRMLWLDLARFISPRRGRYLKMDNDTVMMNGQKKNQHIINGTAFKAVRTLGAGLQGGLTSPSRPWFELGTSNEDLNGYTPVKEWCENVRDRMLAVFAGSNFYASNHMSYEEVGIFGTSAMLIDEDFNTVINCRPFTIGEYCLALDSSYRPDTLYRALNLTARQIEQEFGPRDQLPRVVQTSLECNQPDKRFECLHCIEPSKDLDSSKADYRGMSYRSIYMLRGHTDEDGILRKGGYKTIPFVAPRWATYGVDAYGDSPGIQAIGDIRMLQKMEEKKLRALDKQVDPPMVGPAALANGGASLVPGGLTAIDIAAGQQGFTPAYQVNMNMQQIGMEIERVEKRIQDFFFNDLFLAILGQTKDMTATEVAQRHEEKLVMLGPVLERIQSESLAVVIDRTFSTMQGFGLIPPAPPEMQGMPLQVNYISTLAQAQKLVGTSSLQQFAQFTGAVAPTMPTVLDRIDADQLIMSYADAVGISPKIIRTDAAVAQIRAQRAQSQAAANQTQAAPQLAQAAKNASQASLGGDNNLLQVLTGNKGAGQ
jgi:hypothetical protein